MPHADPINRPIHAPRHAHLDDPLHARSILKVAATFWLVVAIAGQSVFVAYIASFYGGAAITGNLTQWNKILVAGYIRGDSIGNAALAAHLALAILITVGGPLQLVPGMRTRWPALHRWIGRSYLTVAVLTSVAGVFMVWTRNVSGDLPQHIGVTLNAVLIVACAALALHHALRRQIVAHRKWALRLFIVVSGSWFFRVGLLFWLMVNGRPVGFDADAFVGPTLSILTFAESLVPLAVLEVYLRACEGRPGDKLASAGLLFVITLAMAAGIAGAAMVMWLPHL